MDYEDFFGHLVKGAESDIRKELNDICQQLFLEKLYLIYINDSELVWGVRYAEQIRIPPEVLRDALILFVKRHTEIAYPDEQLKIFDCASKEVDYLLNRDLIPYIQSHGGSLAITNIDEASGVVTIDLSGSCSGCPSSLATMKHGVEFLLNRLLPWFTAVESAHAPVDPDFGIDRVLDDAASEVQRRKEEGEHE